MFTTYDLSKAIMDDRLRRAESHRRSRQARLTRPRSRFARTGRVLFGGRTRTSGPTRPARSGEPGKPTPSTS